MSRSTAHYQRLYYRDRLCGDGELERLTEAMKDDGFTPAASWFQRWDEAAQSRALQLERQMGLATMDTARPEFLNEAMRQLIRQLSRPVAPTPAPAPLSLLAPA